MLELTDATAGTLLSTFLVILYVYWMVWLVLVPFVDVHHPLRSLYPPPGALHVSSPELVIPVAGVQLLMAVVSGYVVVRALDDAPAWLTGGDG